MAEIINLKRKRKERQRLAHETEAQANRVRHGRTKAEKAADRDDRIRRDQRLEEKRLDRLPGDET